MNKKEIAKSIDEGLKILKQEPSFVFNMEEIKAIERIDYIQDFIIENGQYNADIGDMEYFSKILNLISKLQKELESQKQENKDLVKEGVKLNAKIVELEKELDKKDKIINEMLKWEGTNITLNKCFNCKDETLECNKCLKQYFYKKVEEENE